MQEHEEHPTQNAQSGSQDAQHAQPADETQPIRHEHKVLSFVRRSGRLDARLQRAWDTYAGTYLLPLNAAEGSLDIRDDWRLTREWIHDTWSNAHPLVIEIGTGQGENIGAAAARIMAMQIEAIAQGKTLPPQVRTLSTTLVRGSSLRSL